jgi:hypothetical protein
MYFVRCPICEAGNGVDVALRRRGLCRPAPRPNGAEPNLDDVTTVLTISNAKLNSEKGRNARGKKGIRQHCYVRRKGDVAGRCQTAGADTAS